MKHLLSCMSMLLICSILMAQDAQSLLQVNNRNFFIENKGQWPEEVKYLTRIGRMNAWITDKGVVYDYYKIEQNHDRTETMKMSHREQEKYERENTLIKGHVVKMYLSDANQNVVAEGNAKQEGYFNYFMGNDPNKWASFVRLYNQVEIKGIYQGIDVKYYFDEGSVRYDYRVKPGADLSQLRFEMEGADGMEVNERGELVIKTSLGIITHGKLYAYQEEMGVEKKVDCYFENGTDGRMGIKAKNYDREKTLIVDPLVYSTFLGVGLYDYGYAVTIGSDGSLYVTGETISPNFPTTTGAYQTTIGSTHSSDIYVTKLDQAGSVLVYSTFLGGSYPDAGLCLAIGPDGSAYVAGGTGSSDFPTTPGAYQTRGGGGLEDAVITKLNPSGTALLYSTFLGGNDVDQANSIVLGSDGSAYMTGVTESNDFPTTAGAFQTGLGGGRFATTSDVFITKISPTGSGLSYSTYLGGSGSEAGVCIALGLNGRVYVTGSTTSSDFPITSGVYQTNYGGLSDAFITALNPAGSSLFYSTFLGKTGLNYGQSLALGSDGSVYVAGLTSSSNFPTTVGAYQTNFGGTYDAFITRFNPTGSDLLFSTFLGGTSYENGRSIALDLDGGVYLTGTTSSSDFPTTTDAHQSGYGGGMYDAFITKLNSGGSTLLHSTFLGGSADELSRAVATSSAGNTHVVGTTSSPDFPTTAGAYQASHGGSNDVFITKLNSNLTHVDEKKAGLPKDYSLRQNFPNPFNPSTEISFALPAAQNVTLKIFNLAGQEIATLLNNERKPAGNHELTFDAGNVPSGVYFYQLQAGEFTETKKMLLVR